MNDYIEKDMGISEINTPLNAIIEKQNLQLHKLNKSLDEISNTLVEISRGLNG